MSEFPIEFSQSIGNIAKALATAQGKIKDATKDALNPHFKNKYATLSSVRAAITAPFSESGLAVTQYFEPHGTEGVMVVTLLMHESGEWIRSKLYLPASKKDAQGFGSAISYGRRYQLAAIANVATDDDDDGAAAVKPVSNADKASNDNGTGKAPPAKSDTDVAALVSAIATAPNTDALAKAILAAGRVKDAGKLTPADLDKCRAAQAQRVRELEAQGSLNS